MSSADVLRDSNSAIGFGLGAMVVAALYSLHG
jgi:hypothetical protein